MSLNLVTKDLTSGCAGANASTISNVATPAYGEGRDDGFSGFNAVFQGIEGIILPVTNIKSY